MPLTSFPKPDDYGVRRKNRGESMNIDVSKTDGFQGRPKKGTDPSIEGCYSFKSYSANYSYSAHPPGGRAARQWDSARPELGGGLWSFCRRELPQRRR